MTLEDFFNPDELQKIQQRRVELANPFAFVPDDVCIIAYFSPGFSHDLSSWRLTLSRSGDLTQDVTISRPSDCKHQSQHIEQNVSVVFVRQILERADEIDFWNMRIPSEDSLSYIIMEDSSSYYLLIRNNGKLRDYSPRSVDYYAYMGDESAKRFTELWNLIHKYAPFPERDPQE